MNVSCLFTYVPLFFFTIWSINRDCLISLIKKQLVVYIAFDITSFILLGRSVGFEITFASKKETTKHAQMFGARGVPMWGGRGIHFKSSKNEGFILGGFLVRLINDLSTPLPFLKYGFDVNK